MYIPNEYVQTEIPQTHSSANFARLSPCAFPAKLSLKAKKTTENLGSTIKKEDSESVKPRQQVAIEKGAVPHVFDS